MDIIEKRRMGYVKLFRALTEWEWYTDTPTKVVFVHLILTVNWKAARWMGVEVSPGSTVTSYGKIAECCGLSEKQVRRAISNLVSTGEVVVSRAGKGQLVTLAGWALYQSDDEIGADKGQEEGSERAAKGQEKGNYRRREESKKARREEVYAATVEDFRLRCKAIADEDPDRLPVPLRAGFLAYWSEPNAKGLMRWQAEKFFDIGRRMDTWKRNAIARGEWKDPKKETGWNPRA